tara:strand:- start:977 stop:1372 length:396 start_codon:yes stop_codon:yes gene_type:complete
MYCTDFVCTYIKLDSEKDQEDLYRQQMLQALSLTCWDSEKVEEKINTLYATLKDYDEITVIFDALRKNDKVMSFIDLFKCSQELSKDAENELLFRMLFSFEYFCYAHRCFIDLIHQKNIEESILKNLINKI